MAVKLFKVIIPVTDLWLKPAFESSRLSQALFGEILEVLRSRQGYYYVKTPDQYHGWVNENHVSPVDKRRSLFATAVVQRPVAGLYKSAAAKVVSGRLSFGTHIEYDHKLSGRAKLVGNAWWISEDDIRMRFPAKKSASAIIKTLRLFIGVPYLWGGKSGFGLDCSGFVQLAYGFHGIALPRDTKDQVRAGKRVARKNMQSGDLIFMPGHVAVYMGKGWIIHSSIKAGGVKIESVEKSSKLYRADIAEKITQVRRVL
jgi:cell wall-associated NlpC family hydrolase